MQIKLKNIGIVKESSLELAGLTVITGKNNSGKTTVGKALYSLLDAVNNLEARAVSDKNYVINDAIGSLFERFRFLRISRASIEQLEQMFGDYPAFYALLKREYRKESDLEVYAHNLLREFEVFDPTVIDPTFFYQMHSLTKDNPMSFADYLTEQISQSVQMLTHIFEIIDRDPELISYARASVNATLRTEFADQIQPVKGDGSTSEVEIFEDGAVSFRVSIDDNRVVDAGIPIFWATKYSRVFFVDDPFIVDGSNQGVMRSRYSDVLELEYDSWFNANRIVPHAMKLKSILHTPKNNSILSQIIVNESIAKIKEKIDSILPGTFDFSSKSDFYVKDGKKLSVANLATGSKMFSIIKLLLENGELDNSTMLILDEPEAHLHPAWQNSFAEVIVLLVKELGVNILLTTHSPNFMLALDAYMRKYSLQEKSNFYQTKMLEGDFVDYCCVNDNMNCIYADFLQYLSEVKALRDKYLLSGDLDE